MKIFRILIAGVVVTVFSTIVGGLTCGSTFNWVYKVEPTNVWKPMDAPPGPVFMLLALILNIILVIVYALIQKGIPGKKKIIKGIMFGLIVWAVGTLPGMLSTYSFMNVADTVVIYWTILGLVQFPLMGIIIAFIYGD
ncbi:MAG: hypothetical protein ABIH42_00830 [Planctomycetota bacterium]